MAKESDLTKLRRAWSHCHLALRQAETLAQGYRNKLADFQARIQRALAVARSQNAKAFELRAATCLAQMWGDQDRHAEARDLLAPVYGWFTEGFGRPDLKEAKARLDELA
jgi:predicted ATPase